MSPGASPASYAINTGTTPTFVRNLSLFIFTWLPYVYSKLRYRQNNTATTYNYKINIVLRLRLVSFIRQSNSTASLLQSICCSRVRHYYNISNRSRAT